MPKAAISLGRKYTGRNSEPPRWLGLKGKKTVEKRTAGKEPKICDYISPSLWLFPKLGTTGGETPQTQKKTRAERVIYQEFPAASGVLGN